ncbi:MAG: LapA family protein [Nitrospirae bacterium]|nr:MAG: LapA family protein [Nitrospirota bacterium]
MIRLILVGILLLLSLTFFLQNQEQEVTLRYFFGLREATTELWRPVLSAFAVGLLVASILLFPAWVQVRLELRRKVKALQEAEADLERLRRPLQATDDSLPLTGARPSEKSTGELPDE